MLISICRLLVLFGVLLSGALFPHAAYGLSSEEQAIANMMEDASGQGRPFLKVDPILSKVARARAEDMARRDYVAHVNPDGYGPNYLIRKEGYTLPAIYGTNADANNIESIAAGRETASAAWKAWMDSPSHKRHLLAESSFYAEQTSVGVGFFHDAVSTYRTYWVVLTAPPSQTASVSVTSPAANASLGSDHVVVSGRADSEVKSTSIQARIENGAGKGPFRPATGFGNWSVKLEGLVPGPNLIRIQALDSTGNVLGQTTRSVQYIVWRKLLIDVSGGGKVTKGFLGESNRAQGKRYTVKATPNAGWLFAGWSGGHTSGQPKLSFIMGKELALMASFIPNPFTERQGTYVGLLSLAGDQSVQNTGRLQLKVNGSGFFTGQIVVGGKRYSVKGKLGTDGSAIVRLGRSGGQVQLLLDTESAGGVTASVTVGGVTLGTIATQGIAKGSTYSRAGRYTVSIPGNPEEGAEHVPTGDGYATLRVSENGNGLLAGSLSDGTRFSVTGKFGGDGAMAIYAPLYSGRGVIAGHLRLSESDVSDLDGSVLWVKPATKGVHPNSFKTEAPLVACRYKAPEKGKTVFDIAVGQNNALLLLEEGGLGTPVTQPLTLGAANRVTLSVPELKRLHVKVNAATGTFSGRFVHPVTGDSTHLGGVIFQKQNAGFGYFLSRQGSGYTRLTSAE